MIQANAIRRAEEEIKKFNIPRRSDRRVRQSVNLHHFDYHLYGADVINSREAHAASWALKRVLRKAVSFTELQGSNHLLRGSSKDRGNTFISGHYSYFSAVTVHFNDCSLTNSN